jgi:hypothetical protein
MFGQVERTELFEAGHFTADLDEPRELHKQLARDQGIIPLQKIR